MVSDGSRRPSSKKLPSLSRLSQKAEDENDDDAIHEARYEGDADDARLVASNARGRADRNDVVHADHVARRAADILQGENGNEAISASIKDNPLLSYS